MSSYANHQVLAGLTLGKSTDYRDTYDASLLQGVPRSLNRDPLGLKADNLPFTVRISGRYMNFLAECERFAAGRRRSC